MEKGKMLTPTTLKQEETQKYPTAEAPTRARNGQPLEACKRPPRVRILLSVESNEPRLIGKESGRSREHFRLANVRRGLQEHLSPS